MNILRFLIYALVTTFLSSCGSSGGGSDSNLDNSSDAQYRITFNSVWDDMRFPTRFPSNAHFSGLIGTTHNDTASFWGANLLASAGVKQVAETGSKSSFIAEIEVEQNLGNAEFLLNGGSIGSSPGDVSYEFSINRNLSLVTLISMVAPSPDWFVGVHDLDLYDEIAADWIDNLTVDLAVYDAGTDRGRSFKSSNNAETPPENIALLTSDAADTDFVNGIQRATMEYIGTFTFERIK